jgi:DNA gyrase subunit A
VNDVPATTGYGEPVQSLFKFGDGERVLRAILLRGPAEEPPPSEPAAKRQRELFSQGETPAAEGGRPLLVASAQGYGFRTSPDLSVTTRAGRRFARVADGDELVSVDDLRGDEIVCLSRSGKGVRFAADEVSELAGVGRGVILMRLEASDRLVGAVSAAAKTALVATLEGGSERPLKRDAFPEGHRGNKGHRVIKRGTVQRLGPARD